MLKLNPNLKLKSEKKSFPTVLFFMMLTFLMYSCKGDKVKGPVVDKPDPVVGSASGVQLPGVIKSMQTKQPLSGVSILVINNQRSVTLLSEPDGSFVVDYDAGTTLDVLYTMANYQSLHQKYEDFQAVRGITIYLEELLTRENSSKKIHGLTLKQDSLGSSTTIPVPDVEVSELPGGNSMKSEGTGDYNLSFTDNKPIFEYQFKIGKNTQIATVRNLSGIRDSTQLDMVLSTNAVGIDIKEDKKE